MQCPICGQENQDGYQFCIKCGKMTREQKSNQACPSCGKDNAHDAQYCGHCGNPLGALHNVNAPPGAPFGQVRQMQSGQFTSNIALDIILSIITCGIYWFFWQARRIRALNSLLNEQRFSFVMWFFLSIITCFIFNVYYEYIMGQAIVEIQKRDNRPISNDLPVLGLVLSIFGLHIVADAIQQNEINKFFK
jgi:hypothetical protein